MRIVITSDWHLDHVTDGHPRFDEIAAAVDHSVDVAIDTRADIYVFAGDLTDPDSNGVHRAQAKAISTAHKLNSAGIENIWIAGNHDVVEDGHGTTTLSPLAASHLGQVFEQPAWVTVGGRAELPFIALPYTPRSHAYDTAAWVRQICSKMPTKIRSGRVLVVGHLSLGGIHPGSETTDMPRGREVTWPTDEIKRWLPNAEMIGGHYHKAQVHKGVTIVGSLARLAHGEEENQPGIMVLEF